MRQAVENNEPCLAVLANFLAPIVHCALAATGRNWNSRKENKKIGDYSDRLAEQRRKSGVGNSILRSSLKAVHQA